MESKEKLNTIRDHLLDEICWRLDKDEQFRIKFCLTNKTNEDIRKYVDGANGIDIINNDLSRLEKYDAIIDLIKTKRVDVSYLIYVWNTFNESRQLYIYNQYHHFGEDLTEEEMLQLKEVFYEGK